MAGKSERTPEKREADRKCAARADRVRSEARYVLREILAEKATSRNLAEGVARLVTIIAEPYIQPAHLHKFSYGPKRPKGGGRESKGVIYCQIRVLVSALIELCFLLKYKRGKGKGFDRELVYQSKRTQTWFDKRYRQPKLLAKRRTTGDAAEKSKELEELRREVAELRELLDQLTDPDR